MSIHHIYLKRLAAYFARGIPLTWLHLLYLGCSFRQRTGVLEASARAAERSEARTTVCKLTGKETHREGPRFFAVAHAIVGIRPSAGTGLRLCGER